MFVLFIVILPVLKTQFTNIHSFQSTNKQNTLILRILVCREQLEAMARPVKRFILIVAYLKSYIRGLGTSDNEFAENNMAGSSYRVELKLTAGRR